MNKTYEPIDWTRYELESNVESAKRKLGRARKYAMNRLCEAIEMMIRVHCLEGVEAFAESTECFGARLAGSKVQADTVTLYYERKYGNEDRVLEMGSVCSRGPFSAGNDAAVRYYELAGVLASGLHDIEDSLKGYYGWAELDRAKEELRKAEDALCAYDFAKKNVKVAAVA